MNKRRLVFLALISIVILLFAIVARHAGSLRLVGTLVPTAFGMTQVEEALFVDADMPQEQREQLVDCRRKARVLLQPIWAELESEPTVLACSTLRCFRSLGGRGGRGVHFADRVLLSPRGLSSTIMAHEWSHAELRKRIGFFTDIPTWFDEGLAVVASADERYSESAYQARFAKARPPSPVHRLETLPQFLATEDAYLISAHEVKTWLERVGPNGLIELVESLNGGRDFYQTYLPREWVDLLVPKVGSPTK